MIFRVAEDAMNKNKCPLDAFISLFELMRAVNQDTRPLSRRLYPFGAIGCGGSAWCRQQGSGSK